MIWLISKKDILDQLCQLRRFCVQSDQDSIWKNVNANLGKFNMSSSINQWLHDKSTRWRKSLFLFSFSNVVQICQRNFSSLIKNTMYGAYYRSIAKCKSEFVSLEQTNDDSKHNRQPKYLKRNLNTNNNEIRGGQKYIDYERKKRKPGSCYRCCVPYPKPSNNHYTTKRPRPTNSWVPI